MKTIVHIELSDLERNDLAKRIHRDPDTKHLATRKEVTELVFELIAYELERGRDDDQGIEAEQEPAESDSGDSGQRGRPGRDRGVPRDSFTEGFVPSRGDEPYLAQPKDPGIAAACSRILDDTALIQNFAWDTVERNRKK